MEVGERVLLVHGGERGGVTQRPADLRDDVLKVGDAEERVARASCEKVECRVGEQTARAQRAVEV